MSDDERCAWYAWVAVRVAGIAFVIRNGHTVMQVLILPGYLWQRGGALT